MQMERVLNLAHDNTQLCSLKPYYNRKYTRGCLAAGEAIYEHNRDMSGCLWVLYVWSMVTDAVAVNNIHRECIPVPMDQVRHRPLV